MPDAPNPQNNAVIRQLQGMRRDMAEVMERESRVVELVSRVNGRLDEMTSRIDTKLNEIQSDLVLMENRILTAITEVRHIAARLDEREDV